MITYALIVLFVAAFLTLVTKKDAITIAAILFSFAVLSYIYALPGITVVRFAGWGAPFGIVWALDKLNLFFALMVSGTCSLVALYSAAYIKKRKHRFYTLLCLLTIGLIGVCLTGDLFNFYVFFEILSISSYALVSFFLDREAIEGSFKYLVMGSMVSSFILLGIGMLYGLTGTLNMADLYLKVYKSPVFLSVLGLLIAGFGMKAAVIPFHAWKPDAVDGTPVPIGVIFVTVSTAAGFYAILRILFIFDLLTVNWLLILFGVISMVGGALAAFLQKNVKRLIAYSGISQMGYVLMSLGLGSMLGITGALYHIFNHVLIKSLLFFSVGCVIYVTGKEAIGEMNINSRLLAVSTGIGVLALSGVPPFNGFVSKWIIYLATWEVSPVLTLISVVVSVFTLAYLMKMYSSIFLTTKKRGKSVPRLLLVPVVILMAVCVLIGIFPSIGSYFVDSAVNALLNPNQYINAVLG